jgi:multiple sugar transport system ATP-binding protein
VVTRAAAASGSAAAHFGGQRIELRSEQLNALTSQRVVVGLRPEDLVIRGEVGLRAAAVLVKDTGKDYLAHARAELDGRSVDLVVRLTDGPLPDRGEPLVLHAIAERAHLFDAKSGRRRPG